MPGNRFHTVQKGTRLNKTQMEEVCQIMSIGNTALKECAEMMGLNQREFRGKLFNNRLDLSGLSAEQLAKLEAAKPLIFAVRDKCEAAVRGNFTRLIAQQAWLAARNNYDSANAKEEFIQEGDIAVLDGIYGYTDTKIKLFTYIWQCIRRRIFDAVNRLNPLCPLTNEAIDLIRRVKEVQNKDAEISDEQAVEVLGFSSEESEVFFRSATKVINEQWSSGGGIIAGVPSRQETHADDYTSNRRGVDRDFKETFFIRTEARQAMKDANLNAFEMACVFGEIFPYHGWKEDIASKHVNPRTGERFTRQNVQYTLERAKNKIKEAFLDPSDPPVENPAVDKFFDEWSAEHAVNEDQRK